MAFHVVCDFFRTQKEIFSRLFKLFHLVKASRLLAIKLHKGPECTIKVHVTLFPVIWSHTVAFCLEQTEIKAVIYW